MQDPHEKILKKERGGEYPHLGMNTRIQPVLESMGVDITEKEFRKSGANPQKIACRDSLKLDQARYWSWPRQSGANPQKIACLATLTLYLAHILANEPLK